MKKIIGVSYNSDVLEEKMDLMSDAELRRFLKNLSRFCEQEDVELITDMDRLVWESIKDSLELEYEN